MGLNATLKCPINSISKTRPVPKAHTLTPNNHQHIDQLTSSAAVLGRWLVVLTTRTAWCTALMDVNAYITEDNFCDQRNESIRYWFLLEEAEFFISAWLSN